MPLFVTELFILFEIYSFSVKVCLLYVSSPCKYVRFGPWCDLDSKTSYLVL